MWGSGAAMDIRQCDVPDDDARDAPHHAGLRCPSDRPRIRLRRSASGAPLKGAPQARRGWARQGLKSPAKTMSKLSGLRYLRSAAFTCSGVSAASAASTRAEISKRAAQVQVGGQLRGQHVVLRARQAAEAEQPAARVVQLLRAEAVLQRARDLLAQRRLHLGAVLRREDGAGQPAGIGLEVVPGDLAVHVVGQAFGLADALPQPRAAAAAEQVVGQRQRRVVGVGVGQRASGWRTRRSAFCLSGVISSSVSPLAAAAAAAARA